MLPKYEIIKQDIIEKINTGEFETGTKIYSEGELKRIYGVSNTTVVRALQDLVLEGYLIRRQGEGTYVRRNLRHKKVYFDELGPFIKRKSEETIKEATQIVQIAMIDDLIWKIQIRYVSDEMLTDDMIVQLQSGGSLSEEYKKKSQLKQLPMNQEIKFSVVANESDVLNLIPEEMLYVDWALNLPIVKFNKTYFDNHKKAIEFSTTLIHYKHYAIKIEYEGI